MTSRNHTLHKFLQRIQGCGSDMKEDLTSTKVFRLFELSTRIVSLLN